MKVTPSWLAGCDLAAWFDRLGLIDAIGRIAAFLNAM
jgi:hypothetical protein